jgi:hypothetical protein
MGDKLSVGDEEYEWSTSTRSTHLEQHSLPSLPRIKQNKWIQAKTPEVRPHHKGVLLPIEAPTKGQVFSNPSPPQANYKSQCKLFSQIASERGWYKLLGSSTSLDTPKQPQSVKELEGSKNNKFAQEVCATSSRDEKERGKTNRESRTQTLHQGLFNQAIWERFQVWACLKLFQQWMQGVAECHTQI